ncbi:Putative cytochrome P450, metallopeptidase, catalytic domain superfamily [Septoria linicola]|uniref:Cytochrome P450, metallopeptidase, catalytic domain superfamily n=1 Tax=Septoria linicola TaxID=215465 RepID=A0A9Q9EHE0_9PEZI|nr:putative cytochrome P450, metallopeptidase, catalytic domain superfamily [Septoria linicola]USW50895.1 Putative cytochrome P450, metallopeptidase, catalytic domain superfamily [Septoria linicola]
MTSFAAIGIRKAHILTIHIRQYSKNGLPFVLPTGQRAEIVLPPSNVAWIVEQPEDVLSGTTVQDDGMGMKYLAPHGPTLDSVHDFSAIRTLQATRYLHRHIPEQMEEISQAFAIALDSLLAAHGEWTDVAIVKVLQEVTVQAVTGTFVGTPMRLNKRYIKDVHRWTIAFGWSGLILRTYLPNWVKPVFGPLLGFYVDHYKRRAIQHILPTIKEHIYNTKNNVETKDEPGDVLKWLIARAMKSCNSAELDPQTIAGKLILFNLFAEHTTSNTTSTILLDLISYSDYPSLLKELRDESGMLLFSPHSSSLTHSVMLKNIVMTSLVRETLRFNPMFARGPVREVVAPGGVVTPGGLHIPQGCHISTSVSAMQRDPDITGLPDAGSYQPRRYYDGSIIVQPDWQGIVRRATIEGVNEQFLSFGLGKHVCPGRHYAGQIIKLILAHLLLHYDIEALQERPKFVEFGELIVPDEKTVVRVKRRVVGGKVWEEFQVIVLHRKVSAYTTQNDATWPESGYGYTVTFCDNFFDKDRVFAKDLVKANPTSTLSKLQTYEHILYHEYMHVHWYGHSKIIVDVADSVVPGETSGSLIYGATSTSQYARKYYGTNANSSVNPMVGINADNYAWYATNYILRKAWGAGSDPLKYLDTDDYTQLDNVKRRRSTDLQAQAEVISFLQHDHSSHDHSQLNKRQSADQTEAVSDLFAWPRNCIWTLEEHDHMCTMILDSYDDYVSEKLGTTLSPQCQTINPATPFSALNAVHPDCKCTDNASGKDVKLYNIAKCRGFVGVVIGCRDGKDGGCDCRTKLNDGSHHVSKKDKGDKKCSTLSRGGMTEDDIDDLIATGG